MDSEKEDADTQKNDVDLSEELMQRGFFNGNFYLSELAPVLTKHQTTEIPSAVRAFCLRYDLTANDWGHQKSLMASLARFAALGANLKTATGTSVVVTVNELLPFLVAADPISGLARPGVDRLLTENTDRIAQAVLGNDESMTTDNNSDLLQTAAAKILEQNPLIHLRRLLTPQEWVQALRMEPEL